MTADVAPSSIEPPESLLASLKNLYQQQQYAQAETLARQLTADYPEHGAGWKYLGSVLHLVGRTQEALGVHQATAKLRPHDFEAHFNLATQLEQMARFDDAASSYLQAIRLNPGNPEAYNRLSNIFLRMGLFSQAETVCRQAIALRPDMPAALNTLGSALHAQGKSAEALAQYQQALALKPDWAQAYNNLAICLKDQGYSAEAKEAYRKALSLQPDWAMAHSNLLYALNLDVQTTPAQLHAEHMAFGQAFEPGLQALQAPHRNDKNPQRHLHIGFVSGDLHDHALANFLEPLFKGLSEKTELTLHAYYTHIYEDAVTQRLRGYFQAWNQVANLSEDALAAKIRSDNIDILIDLSGHTGHNRLLTFARKPAPIQASYLGYLGTTGMRSIDYFICDTFWVPPGELDWQFAEKMAYLPSATVFEPHPLSPDVNALPALPNGCVTFGSFNRANKLNPSVIALWSLLLQAVPAARMVLGGIPLERQRELFGQFAAQGVDIKRLTFFPRSNMQEYLALHHQVDFCLDSFPYGGGATHAHAAWMGVPTLCLAGESPASRFGPALMHLLGLDAWIADSIDDFLAKGVYWAEHTTELAQLRSTLRERFTASPMGRPQPFADHFTRLLRAMWVRWCHDLPPARLHADAPVANKQDTGASGLDETAKEPAPWSDTGLTAECRDLFAPLNAPYYVYAPPFRETSGGIRAMHYLCHALNLAGEEAYVVTSEISTQLRTPVLTDDIREGHAKAGREPIAIYPEIITGNPLNSRHVVRYLLNTLGRINSQPVKWLQSDLVYAFCDDVIPPGIGTHLLEMPLVNKSIFNTQGCEESRRHGSLLFINRYLTAGGPLLPVTENATEISFRVPSRTPQELSQLYKSAELLYTYEHSTACYEAMLCGCPVIYLPNAFLLPDMPQGTLGREGWAWGNSPEQIAFAKNSVARVDANYKAIEARFWGQLDAFVTATQADALQEKDPSKSALLFPSTAQLGVGIDLFERGELDLAMFQFIEALGIDPMDPLPYAYVAFICATQAWDEKARSFMEQAMDLAPDRTDFLFKLGEIYLNRGQTDTARQYVQRVARQTPELLDAYPACAQLLRQAG